MRGKNEDGGIPSPAEAMLPQTNEQIMEVTATRLIKNNKKMRIITAKYGKSS